MAQGSGWGAQPAPPCTARPRACAPVGGQTSENSGKRGPALRDGARSAKNPSTLVPCTCLGPAWRQTSATHRHGSGPPCTLGLGPSEDVGGCTQEQLSPPTGALPRGDTTYGLLLPKPHFSIVYGGVGNAGEHQHPPPGRRVLLGPVPRVLFLSIPMSQDGPRL